VPLPPARRFVPIMTIRGTQAQAFLAVGHVLGALAHFFDGRSWPCSAMAALPCQHCKTQKARWKGFLPCNLPSGAKRIVEITEGAMQNCQLLRSETLPGTWLEFRRIGHKENSPLYCWLHQTRDRQARFEPFDPEPSVLHMWGIQRDGNCVDMGSPQG